MYHESMGTETDGSEKTTFLWKIGGEAGFGIMTTGLDFAKIAARMGYHTADYADYPSLIRGGHNTYEVHISADPIHSSKQPIDMLVCLNKDTYENHKSRLHSGSVILYDSEMFEIPSDECACPHLHIPLKQILKDNNGLVVHMNTIMMGAVMAMIGWPLEEIHSVIEHTFKRKGEEVVNQNKLMSQLGYDYAAQNYADKKVSMPPGVSKNDGEKMVMTGNDAFCIGAVAADCRLYVAYPMTPSSTILTRMAKWASKTGMVVRHAEDEISVINEAIGGSFAGVRAACGSSGGGFALMAESLSYAGITETPLVVFLAQRSGPATGMPTWTEQGELLFSIFAGHGEFPKIVLAPGDVEEMYQMAVDAFNLADIYQTPVIVLSDKHLSESHWSTSKVKLDVFLKSVQIDRGKITSEVQVEKGGKYLRYKDTEDGISPMLVPGQPGIYFQANSYEHVEDGHTTEDAGERIKQVEKRNKKEVTYLNQHFKAPNVYGDMGMAQHVFVTWGSTKNVMLDSMKLLGAEGIKTAMVHFTHMWPLHADAVGGILQADGVQDKTILVESNSHAQLERLLRMATGFVPKHKLLKYNGRQIFREDVIDFVHEL